MYVNIMQEGSQDKSLLDNVLKASQLAVLSRTGDEGETAITDKFHDH